MKTDRLKNTKVYENRMTDLSFKDSILSLHPFVLNK